MTSKTYCILSKEDADKIRCIICGGYLSVAPVKSSSDGTLTQCGRCDFDVEDINIINLTYEKLAQYTKFPCINEGCDSKLLWSRVEQHEMICALRKINCPILDCRIDMLGQSEMMSHFKEFHKDSITANVVSVIWQLLDPQDFSLGMLIHNEKPYIYLIGYNSDRLRVSLYSLDCAANEKYKLNLSTVENRMEILIQGEAIIPYNDKKHCIKCFTETCTSNLHKYSTIYGNEYEMTTELEATSIKSILRSNQIYCELIVDVKNGSEKRNIFDNSNIIRKTVECPVCNNYMLPPIHNCSTGHIICDTCKKDLSKCPTCEADFPESRNYTVEELCENVNLPCQNNKEGCKFIGNSKKLQLHEEMCRLAKK